MVTLYVLGYPGALGGANTECWHTIRLWRRAGWQVHLIPTWKPDPAWKPRLDRLGCRTYEATPSTLHRVPGLPGAPVVSMCNTHFHAVARTLRELACKRIWVNCMTFLFPEERESLALDGPADAYVFQSAFQRRMLEPALNRFGYQASQGHLIRGAFDIDEFAFRPGPHAPPEPFVIGRLARPQTDKWSKSLWRVFSEIPYAPRRAVVMGWNEQLAAHVGRPPSWATCYAPGECTPQDFYGQCHVMVPLNGGARENWPRVGLEAMASGVAIVAPRRWGWREMIVDGTTGFLVDSEHEMRYRIAQLAYEPRRRRSMIDAARRHVQRLADPDVILRCWRQLLRRIGALAQSEDGLSTPTRSAADSMRTGA